MALPTFVNAGAKASGTGAVTPALPASMQADDIVLLVATTIAGGSLSITANGSIGTWNAVTGSPIDVTGGEKLYVWWGRWASGTTGPTVTPGSDHCCAGTVAYRGCITNATVINNQATGSETTSDTSFSFATGISTTVADCMCIGICTSGQDTNTAQVPVMANTSLTALASRLNYNTVSGGGGGFGLSEGAKATAGTMGTWTTTIANASPKAYLTLALRPVNTVTTKTQLGRSRVQKQVTATTLGRSRVQKQVTATTLGIAKIQAPDVVTTQTTLGRARVQKSVTATELGRARVQKTGTQTQLGRARIQKVITQTQDGLARITAQTTQTITGRASIATDGTATQTQLGRSRIQSTTTQNQLGLASIVGGAVPEAAPDGGFASRARPKIRYRADSGVRLAFVPRARVRVRRSQEAEILALAAAYYTQS